VTRRVLVLAISALVAGLAVVGTAVDRHPSVPTTNAAGALNDDPHGAF